LDLLDVFYGFTQLGAARGAVPYILRAGEFPWITEPLKSTMTPRADDPRSGYGEEERAWTGNQAELELLVNEEVGQRPFFTVPLEIMSIGNVLYQLPRGGMRFDPRREFSAFFVRCLRRVVVGGINDHESGGRFKARCHVAMVDIIFGQVVEDIQREY
jgi:hypothetical protein